MELENFQIQSYEDIISIIGKTNISPTSIQIISDQILYKNNKKKTKSFVQIFSCETFYDVNEVVYTKGHPKNLTNIWNIFHYKKNY